MKRPALTTDMVKINLRDTGYKDVSLEVNNSGDFQDSPANALGIPMTMPLRMRKDETDQFWLFPVEPQITIDGGNVVAKRTVAKGKGRGTIKERWTKDDYSVTIEGTLMGYANAYQFPEADLKKLREQIGRAHV